MNSVIDNPIVLVITLLTKDVLNMYKEHEILFTPFKIRDCEIKNRFVMAAMGTGGMVNSDGTFNERGVEYYVERAKGGVGLIVTGTMYVENDIEKVLHGVMPVPTQNKNKFIITSSEMIERIHAYDCKIFAQLTAGFGRVMSPHLLLRPPVSSSETGSFWNDDLKCRELTVDEIHTIIEKCAESALICKDAGYDGVEIHAVHEGYLLDQFALSLFNKRTDEYGGDLKGRLKFACDIVKRIKQKCGQEYPVLLRYSLKSFIKGIRKGGLPNENFVELGRDTDEGLEAAGILTEAGYDCLDVDSGSYEAWYWAHPPLYFEKGVNIPFGKMIKDKIDVPVIITGKMEDPSLSSKAIINGATDMIGLGRSLLADPHIVKKIKENRYAYIRPCLGCHDGCMNRLVSSKAMCCAVNPTSGREALLALKPVIKKKRVLIVGAGISGMEAARILKLRGHEVVICEKESQAGGVIKVYNSSDYKQGCRELIDWYLREVEDLNIPIYYNTEINELNIDNYERDILIFATGSIPKELKIEGNNKLIKAEDLLNKKYDVGETVVIIGGGLVGCELAFNLAKNKKQVFILETRNEILNDKNIPKMNRDMLIDLLHLHKVKIQSCVKINSIKDGIIKYSINDINIELKADNFVYAIGYESNDNLYRRMMLKEKEIYLLGDARQVKNIMYSIWDAYELANNL